MLEYGNNRLVIGLGKVVIKVAILWPHPPIWMKIYRKYFVRREPLASKKVSLLTKYPLRVMTRHLLGGILSNIEESRFYKKNPELPIAPTVFSLVGLVNIQIRGIPIDPKDIVICPFRENSEGDCDLNNPKHFGWIEGKIHLLDYGLDPLRDLLDELEIPNTSRKQIEME